MAMMLPIMAGFQMAISLTELELGNDQVLYKKFIAARVPSNKERADLDELRGAATKAVGASFTECRDLTGFALVGSSSDHCAYNWDQKPGRFSFNLNTGAIDVCLVKDDPFRDKCSSEVSQS
jgi:hypothetical protein